MAWLDGLSKPVVAPLLVVATIFNGFDAPTTIPAQVPVDAMVGFVVHLTWRWRWVSVFCRSSRHRFELAR